MKSAMLTLFFGGLCASLRADEKAPSSSIQIPCATWFHGYLHMSDAVVVGKVAEVTETVSDIDPESKVFKYSLAVSAYGGECPELKNVTEIQSENCHAVKAGNWVIMLVQYYENKPDLATGSRPLDVIAGVNDPLAKLFIAKGADYPKYTAEDMLMLKERMPAEYENILLRREWHIDQTSKSEGAAGDGDKPSN